MSNEPSSILLLLSCRAQTTMTGFAVGRPQLQLVMLKFLWLSLLFYLSTANEVDYKIFHDGIRHAIETSKNNGLIKPLSNTSTPLDCHLPESAIMISVSNGFTAELILLRHKAMTVWNLQECLESRFVTVCLDEKCKNVCDRNNIKNCILLPIPTEDSEFMSGSHRFLAFLKHVLLVEALKIVDSAFFFDADVLLFRNPFVDTLHRRDEDGHIIYGSDPPEAMWQAGKFELGCGGNINGGQLYFRNTTPVHKFYDYFMSFKDKMLNTSAGRNDDWDQAVMMRGLKEVKMNYCSLPFSRFSDHCMVRSQFPQSHNLNRSLPLNDIIGFHGCCVGPIHMKKTKNMLMYNALLQRNESNRLVDFI